MLQHVDIVLIGKNIPASYTTADALAVGDVALFDQNRAILKTAAEAANATSLYVGVAQNKVSVTMPDGTVAQKANIKFGNEIKKDSKPSAVIGEYVAPVQDKIVITLTDATIVAGHRYVLRMVYKDIYEAVRVCCEKGMGSKNGYILASGCDIPIGTPPEKIMHFIDAARVYGRMK